MGFGTDGLADERINGLIDGWITMDGWTCGWMGRRTDGVRVIHLSIYRFVLVPSPGLEFMKLHYQ